MFDESKRDIELIVEAMTGDEPLCYTFIHQGITEKKSEGLIGGWSEVSWAAWLAE